MLAAAWFFGDFDCFKQKLLKIKTHIQMNSHLKIKERTVFSLTEA